MKKYKKAIIAILILAAIGIALFIYLSYNSEKENSAEKSVRDTEIAALTMRDIEKNYPESPKGVVELYARITKAYYMKGVTDQQIETLGVQARLLFDDELKGKQTEAEFMEALKVDIAVYNASNRYISDYKVDAAANFEYKTIEGKDYAIGLTVYYVREGKTLSPSYMSYKLRKDNNGKWKILYWELVNQNLMNQ